MKKVAVTLAAFLTLAISNNLFAQDTNAGSHTVTISIPEVAILDLEGGSSITLAPTPPSEAGNAFDFTSATDNSIWVNYSSIVASGKQRTVTAEISAGTVPTGLLLKVIAGSYSGSGKGTLGTPGAQITLSGTAQAIISNIGSCYTGTGASSGHQLTYNLVLNSVNDYDKLVQGSTPVTVTYTITDDV